MLTRDDVTIKTPCHVDFSRMTRRELGRFCSDCNKVVHDLTLLTEAEAKSLLASRETARLCVRYAADDRGRVVFLPDVPTRNLTARKRTVMAAATLAAAFGAGCEKPMMMGDVAGPNTVTNLGPRKAFDVTKDGARISIVDAPGSLVDEAGQATTSAFVTGSCTGEAVGCKQAIALLAESTSTSDYVDRLQRAGFSVVCQTTLEGRSY